MQYSTAIQNHIEGIVTEARNEAEEMNFINATAEGTFTGYYLAKSVDQWYSRKDFAKLIGVSPNTVARAIGSGELEETCGRIHMAQYSKKLLEFLNKKKAVISRP